MSAILCLAHYCDTHGPTPLMTCEGLPSPCSICFEEDGARTRRRSSVSRSMRSDGSNRPSKAFARIVPTTIEDDGLSIAPVVPTVALIDTPPDSPQSAAVPIGRPAPRQDSSFRKTYGDNDMKRAVPCENCALTIPTKVKDQIPDGAPGSPMKNGQSFSSSPVIRSKVCFERVSTFESGSLPSDSTTSNASDDSASSAEHPGRAGAMTRTITASTISSIQSSSSSSSSTASHNHYFNYTSSHDPASTANYSALRASCLRTLSCETLPPSSSCSTSISPSSPTSLFPPSFSSMSTNASARISNPQIGGGGPIFFGDAQAGYTTAFIFRVRDPYARGQRRLYAFICLSQQKEGKAMQAFGILSKAFKDLATWIQGLAEAESDKLDNAIVGSGIDGGRRGSDNVSVASSFGTNSGSMLSSSGFGGGYSRRAGSIGGGGMYMNSPRNRGMAELVGRPDFFLDLHARFVGLAAQLTSLGL